MYRWHTPSRLGCFHLCRELLPHYTYITCIVETKGEKQESICKDWKHSENDMCSDVLFVGIWQGNIFLQISKKCSMAKNTNVLESWMSLKWIQFIQTGRQARKKSRTFDRWVRRGATWAKSAIPRCRWPAARSSSSSSSIRNPWREHDAIAARRPTSKRATMATGHRRRPPQLGKAYGLRVDAVTFDRRSPN